MKILNIPFIKPTLASFFNNKILGTIQYREKENKSRADMIQLLLDARKEDSGKCVIIRQMSKMKTKILK